VISRREQRLGSRSREVTAVRRAQGPASGCVASSRASKPLNGPRKKKSHCSPAAHPAPLVAFFSGAAKCLQNMQLFQRQAGKVVTPVTLGQGTQSNQARGGLYYFTTDFLF